MDKGQKAKNIKQIRHQNVLESLKDIGDSTAKSFNEDLLNEIPADLFKQIFGETTGEKKFSGDIIPGESLELNEVLSGKHEEEQQLRQQITLERKLREEETARKEKKIGELRIQLNVLMQEVLNLAKSTQNLGEKAEVAAMQAPANPGVYHVIFFEKLIEFLQSFRQKIDDSAIWLNANNSRAEKKNYWARYKKSGSKFLLSPDHYLQRSAG